MKKIYFTAILFIFISRYSSAQNYFQYFDGADTIYANSVNVEIDTASSNTWQIGGPDKIIFNSAATLPNAIVTDTTNYYPVNNTSIFRIKVVNNFGPNGIFALQWKQKLDMDTSSDGGLIEFSIDQGATWQNAFNNPYVYNFYGYLPSSVDTTANGEDCFSGTDTTWRDIWLCFDLSWMSFGFDTLHFRYTLKSDSINNNKEGWLIDNFVAHQTFVHTVDGTTQKDYLNVYPNPTNGILHIQARKLMVFHIIETMELIDAQGRVVESWKNIPTKFWFDTSKYEAGMYLLKVTTNYESQTFPVVVTQH